MSDTPSLDEVLPRIHLTHVAFSRFEGHLTGQPVLNPDHVDVTYSARTADAEDNSGLRAWLELPISTDAYGAVIEVQITYQFSDGLVGPLPDGVVREFLDKSFAYTAVPFLRQGVIDVCSRLGVPAPLLPLTGPARGSLGFSDDTQSPSAQEGSAD